MNFKIRLCLILLGLTAISCSGFFPHPQEDELRAAYEYSTAIIAEAQRTSNTSILSDALTQHGIDIVEEELARERDLILKENLSYVSNEEIEIIWLNVIEYNPPEAIIEIKYFYRHYEYDLNTGEVTYYDPPNKRSRTMKVRMRQENGIWKFDETLEFVDWSG